MPADTRHRYYCPACGEVTCGTPGRVFPHIRNFWGVGLPSSRCPGGPADPEKDRAP